VEVILKGHRFNRNIPFPPRMTKPKIELKTRSSFFARHNRLMTFCGAFIVFVTFISKETVSDAYKRKAESTEKALGDMKQAEFRVEIFSELYRIDPRFNRRDDGSDLRLIDFEERCRAVDFETDTKKALAITLERQDYQNTIERIRDADRKIIGDVWRVKRTDPSSTDYAQAIPSLQNRVEELERENTSFAISATLDTQDLAEHMSNLAHRWTIASWIFYAIGWGLGLAGKLYSVEAVVGGGE
jgi:hypothetical protein